MDWSTRSYQCAPGAGLWKGDQPWGHSENGGGPKIAQILRDPTSYDTAMALILVATPMAIILIAVGMIIFGGLVLP